MVRDARGRRCDCASLNVVMLTAFSSSCCVPLVQGPTRGDSRRGIGRCASLYSPRPTPASFFRTGQLAVLTSVRSSSWNAGWLPRPTLLRSCSRCLGPPRRATLTQGFLPWAPLAMAVESPSCADAIDTIRASAAALSSPVLQPFCDATCTCLKYLDDVMTRAQAVVDAAVSGSDDDNRIADDDGDAMLSSSLDWSCRTVSACMKDIQLSNDGGAIQEAATLLPLYRQVIGAEKMLAIAAAHRVSTELMTSKQASTERRARLLAAHRFVLHQVGAVVHEHHEALRGDFVNLTMALRKLRPIAASLDAQHRLLAGLHRSPGHTLVLVPGRIQDICIPRNDKVVQTLCHIAAVRNGRVASVIVSSPGVGKSHLAWDLADALGSLDDPKFADAFLATSSGGIMQWKATCAELRGTRPCIITFNSGSRWGQQDIRLMCSDEKMSARPYLPLYLRVLWSLRCADGLSWDVFARHVESLLENGITAEDVIREAVAALREQPTLVIVEELNNIVGEWPEVAGGSPGEAAFMPVQASGADGHPSKPQANVIVDAPPCSPSTLDVYRHELCSWTGAETNLSVLFTAPYFGLIYDEVKHLLTAEEKLLVASRAAELEEAVDLVHLQDRETRLSSLSSGRRGSPYFVLSAVQLDFMNMDELAEYYFVPVLESIGSIRTGLPFKSSFDVPSDVTARALARLSGGHPRSAGFLRQKLVEAAAGPFWSSVVQPAWQRLSQDKAMQDLLFRLSRHPIAIVAALHHCKIFGSQPLEDLGTSCGTWEDLVSANLLTASIVTDDGEYLNPCLPPLYLLALLETWKLKKAELTSVRGTIESFTLVEGVLSALAVACGSRNSESAASSVWEYTALYADVTLTRVRAAAVALGRKCTSLVLPRDYAAVTLLQLYPGTTKYYTKANQPLLKKRLYNALRAVNVNEDAAANQMATILKLPPSELVSTVFKCLPEQMGFDSIKFLAPSASRTPDKADLVAVVKSNKFTGRAEEYVKVDEHVTKSLRLVKKSFGEHWGEWSTRVVLVVESNLRAAKKPLKLLSAAQSSKVIIVTAEDHLNVYGRGLSGFMADGPIMYDASLVKQ